MLCYSFLTESPACSAKVSPNLEPPLAPCGSQARHCDIPHSINQDTLPIVFLISKQVIPYRTRRVTSCSGGGGVYS
jgi:hypothetical protein